MNFKPGTYRHFKGGEYEALFLAKHSETQEDMVIYRNAKGEVWARPLAMWSEHMERDGYSGPRFLRIHG